LPDIKQFLNQEKTELRTVVFRGYFVFWGKNLKDYPYVNLEKALYSECNANNVIRKLFYRSAVHTAGDNSAVHTGYPRTMRARE
jgi:hypothetical protein